MRREPVARASAALVLVLGVSCARRPAPADPAYLAAIEKQRAARLAALTSESGWLTLVGIHWLKPGSSRLGSGAANEIVLAGEGVPALVGRIEVAADGGATFVAAPGGGATMRGEPVASAVLRSDRQGTPDVIEVAGLRMSLIERSGSLALRVRDPNSPRRTRFKGIPAFPVDPAFRIAAVFEPYPAPREVTVASAQGPAQKMLAPGLLRFRVGSTECTLEPFADSADAALFLVFADATSGRETYGAGRFLDAAAPAPGTGTVVLDFNLAYNPPCAFTPYATCPLPPPASVLPVAIRAGERTPEGH
jgi:hypothetical protein